jgi:hypothetical protein
MGPCHTSLSAKRRQLRPAVMLVLVAGLLAPPSGVAKIINVFPPQQLLAVGRYNVSGAASVERCNERFANLLQAKVDACLAAAGMSRPSTSSPTACWFWPQTGSFAPCGENDQETPTV